MPGPWSEDAACTKLDHPDFFHSEDAWSQRRAKAVCSSCPVIEGCLDHAIRWREPKGVWGGLTTWERRKVARERIPLLEGIARYIGSRADVRFRPDRHGRHRRA